MARQRVCRALSAAFATLGIAYALAVLGLYAAHQAPDFGPQGMRLVATPWATWMMLAFGAAVLLRLGGPGGRWDRLGQGLAVAIAAVGGGFLFEHLMGWPANAFDRFWFPDQLAAPQTATHGRPSLVPAAGFLLYGLAVALADAKAWASWRPSEVLMLLGLTPTYLGLVGYAFAAEALYPITQAVGALSNSVPTWAYACLSFSAIVLRPSQGLVGVATSEGPGGVVLRRVLPVTVVLPMLVGLARVTLDEQQEAWLGFGPAAAMAITMLLPLGMVLGVALGLNRAADVVNEAQRALQSQSHELGLRTQALVEQSAALALARDQALAATRAKGNFLTSVGHELRTPLNAILGYAELLLEDAQAEGRTHDEKDLGRIVHAAKGQLAMVEEVLALASMDRQGAGEAMGGDGLLAFLRDLAGPFGEQAEAKGLAFQLALQGPLPDLRVDPQALARLLRHLLRNAVQHTPEGWVRLAAQADAEGLVLEVADSGPGLPPERLAEPAAAFLVHDDPNTRSGGGLGVGLAMAHRLAEAMGGQLALSCPPEGGTRVRFSLPVVAAGA